MGGTSKQSTRKINQMNKELTKEERAIAEKQAKYNIERNNREKALHYATQLHKGTSTNPNLVLETAEVFKTYLINQELLTELEQDMKSKEFANSLKPV